jgi:hypothetical protein
MPPDGASIEDGYSVFDGMPYASAGIAEVRIRESRHCSTSYKMPWRKLSHAYATTLAAPLSEEIRDLHSYRVLHHASTLNHSVAVVDHRGQSSRESWSYLPSFSSF